MEYTIKIMNEKALTAEDQKQIMSEIVYPSGYTELDEFERLQELQEELVQSFV